MQACGEILLKTKIRVRELFLISQDCRSSSSVSFSAEMVCSFVEMSVLIGPEYLATEGCVAERVRTRPELFGRSSEL